MELRPADLGDGWHIAFVRLRAGYRPEKERKRRKPGKPAPGLLGKRWARSLELTPEVTTGTHPFTSRKTGIVTEGMMGGFWWLPLSFIGPALATHNPEFGVLAALSAAGLGWLSYDLLPSRKLRDLHRHTLTRDEVTKLRAQFTPENGAIESPLARLGLDIPSLLGPQLQYLLFGRTLNTEPPEAAATQLERDYLSLIEETLETPVTTPETQGRVRETLRLLGEAILRLPLPPEASALKEDSGDLLADAEMLVARARQERDTVVADSLLRQAEAKAAQATAVDNALKLSRRTRILREELRAQVAATRAALPTLAQGSSGGSLAVSAAGPLRRVADSVQAVSREADAVWEAHQELAASLGEPSAYRPAAVAPAAAETVAAAPPPRTTGWTPTQPETPGARLYNGRR